MSAKVNLIFPVETINRELDYRLILACLYVTKSNRIFIGGRGVHDVAHSMRGGIYVGKTIFWPYRTDDLRMYLPLKQRDFTCVILDEEGAVYQGDADQWRRALSARVDPRQLAPDDYLCTWGEFQNDYYRSFGATCSPNIRTTGHPRFDLYKPEYRKYFDADVQSIRNRYGDFILVNTNTAFANNPLGISDTFSARVGYDPAQPARRLQHVGMWAYYAANVASFVKLIHRLSVEYPKVNVVFRPHPSEDQSFYRTVFRGVPNIHVVHEGNVSPWLLACRFLLFDGCTTGIEAFLAQTNSINYQARPDPRYKLMLPNLFGAKCSTENEVVEEAGRMLSATGFVGPSDVVTDTAEQLFANFRSSSIDKVVDVLREAEQRRALDTNEFSRGRFLAQQVHQQMTWKAKSIVRPLSSARMRAFRYASAKFYGFSRDAIRRKIDTIQQMTNKNIRWTYHSDALISIEAG